MLGFTCSVLVAASLLVTWYSRRTILSNSPSLPLYRCNSTPTSASFAGSILRWAPSIALVHWLPGVANAVSSALCALSPVVHEVSWHLGLSGRTPASLWFRVSGLSVRPASVRMVRRWGGGAKGVPFILLLPTVAAALGMGCRSSFLEAGGCLLELRRRIFLADLDIFSTVRLILILGRGAGDALPSLLCCILGADQAEPMGGTRGGRSPSVAMPVAASKAPHLHRCHGGQGQPLCLRGRAMRF